MVNANEARRLLHASMFFSLFHVLILQHKPFVKYFHDKKKRKCYKPSTFRQTSRSRFTYLSRFRFSLCFSQSRNLYEINQQGMWHIILTGIENVLTHHKSKLKLQLQNKNTHTGDIKQKKITIHTHKSATFLSSLDINLL